MNRALGVLNRGGMWRAARPERGDRFGLYLTEDPLPIVCEGIPVFLHATMEFEMEPDRRDPHRGGMKVGVREYIFALRADRTPESEFLAWHWHPDVVKHAEPHVHAKANHPDVADFGRLHVPTSRVFFEDVLLFLHEEMGATCSEGGADRLRESRARTRRWATWR